MWAGAGEASAARWRPLLVLVRLFGWVPLFLTQPRSQQRFVEGCPAAVAKAASGGTNSSVEQSPQPCVLIDCALQQSQRQRCCSFGSYLGCSSPTNCASAKRVKLQQSVGPSLHASVWIPERSESCMPCACFPLSKRVFLAKKKNASLQYSWFSCRAAHYKTVICRIDPRPAFF